ncbi:hypothetical protein QT15_23480 [Pseudoalteromonas flavipulchra NCIMB 2033 = ATCC BAA-314]|nr:hypothetical protein QT15_23480 [Pseudoalteromonas flavipulchra NCIMB 2033 = ATCC BAA-314]
MLNFIEYILESEGVYKHSEPTQTSVTIHHYRHSNEGVYVNFNLIIDEVCFDPTEEDKELFRAFQNDESLDERLSQFAGRIRCAVQEYKNKAKETTGNQEGTTFKLTSDLRLEKEPS